MYVEKRAIDRMKCFTDDCCDENVFIYTPVLFLWNLILLTACICSHIRWSNDIRITARSHWIENMKNLLPKFQKKKTIQNHCKLINEFHFKWKLFAKILIEILASVAERLTVKFDCCHYYCFIKYTCHIRRELPLKKKTFKRGDIFTNNLFVLLTILIT